MKFISTAFALLAVLSLKPAEAGNMRTLQTDPNCFQWNFQKNKCNKCSYRYYMKDGVCTQVSDDCATWDSASGSCKTCYKGFHVENGNCVVDE